MGKIKTRKELVNIVKKLRKDGKKIVTINGSYDILHIGHIRMLEEAKKQGDVLIVGVNSDNSVKQYKGKDRPINPEESRAGLIAALEVVDYVTIFNEPDPRALLEAIKPDVHVNGPEWGGQHCIEAEVVKKNGGRLHIVNRVGNYSTTNIIKKILKAYGKH